MKEEKYPVLLWLRATIPRLIPDALAVAGGALIVRGVTMIFLPAGWITGGLLLIAAAVIYSKGGGA